MAQGMGYPTKKSEADLEAVIAKADKYTDSGVKQSVQLQSPTPLSIDAHAHTCYTLVMHLAQGAAWGEGAEPGIKFSYTGASGNGTGGPGVVGPGAVVSLSCAKADGPIAVTLAPFLDGDTAPLGTGALDVQVWTRTLTAEEEAQRDADRDQQIKEQQDFAAKEAEQKRQKAASGCSLCETRYQGCIGAGIGQASCEKKYEDCAFDEVGAEWMSACTGHRR